MHNVFFLLQIKIFKISAKTYAKNCINSITVHKKTVNQFYE